MEATGSAPLRLIGCADRHQKRHECDGRKRTGWNRNKGTSSFREVRSIISDQSNVSGMITFNF